MLVKYIYILIETLLKGLPKKLRNKKEVLIPFFYFFKTREQNCPFNCNWQTLFCELCRFYNFNKKNFMIKFSGDLI